MDGGVPHPEEAKHAEEVAAAVAASKAPRRADSSSTTSPEFTMGEEEAAGIPTTAEVYCTYLTNVQRAVANRTGPDNKELYRFLRLNPQASHEDLDMDTGNSFGEITAIISASSKVRVRKRQPKAKEPPKEPEGVTPSSRKKW